MLNKWQDKYRKILRSNYYQVDTQFHEVNDELCSILVRTKVWVSIRFILTTQIDQNIQEPMGWRTDVLLA
jgi:hypothetical protein